MRIMSEINKNNRIDIIFRSQSGEINRITTLLDREAQNIIRERRSLGNVPIASVANSDAIDLTEKYRVQESHNIFSAKR